MAAFLQHLSSPLSITCAQQPANTLFFHLKLHILFWQQSTKVTNFEINSENHLSSANFGGHKDRLGHNLFTSLLGWPSLMDQTSVAPLPHPLTSQSAFYINGPLLAESLSLIHRSPKGTIFLACYSWDRPVIFHLLKTCFLH